MKVKIGLGGRGVNFFSKMGGGESPFKGVTEWGRGENFFWVKGGTKFFARVAFFLENGRISVILLHFKMLFLLQQL